MKLVAHDSLGPDCKCKPLAIHTINGLMVDTKVLHHVDRVSQALRLAHCQIIWQRTEAIA